MNRKGDIGVSYSADPHARLKAQRGKQKNCIRAKRTGTRAEETFR